MKWSETIASTCRYGDVAGRLFGDGDVIFEHSEADYQGYANIFVALPDGKFAHYEWSYGSCSGCDEWEARGLSDDEIEKEMRNATAFFDNIDQVKKYLKLEDEYKEAKIPSANSPTNGSIPGMLRYMGGDVGTDFQKMGKAFAEWEAGRRRVSGLH